MKNPSEIREILTKNRNMLSKKFQVKEIGLFGSYVRGEQKESSDIDILVEFEETPTLLEFIELENCLTELLGVKVDLVMKRALKPKIRVRLERGCLHMRIGNIWDIPKIKLIFEKLLEESGRNV